VIYTPPGDGSVEDFVCRNNIFLFLHAAFSSFHLDQVEANGDVVIIHLNTNWLHFLQVAHVKVLMPPSPFIFLLGCVRVMDQTSIKTPNPNCRLY
jgi:hypothetical protein